MLRRITGGVSTALCYADIGFVALILRGDRLQLSQRLVFGRRVADRRERQLNVRRRDLLDQRAERASAHRCQQLLAVPQKSRCGVR